MSLIKPEQIPELRHLPPEARQERWREWCRSARFRHWQEWVVLALCVVGFAATGIVIDEEMLLIREIHGAVWHYVFIAAIGVIWCGLIPMWLSVRSFRRQLRVAHPELDQRDGFRSGRRLLLGGIAVAPVIVIAAWAAWYYLPMAPLSAEGPFHGTTAPPMLNREGALIPVFNERTLEANDPLVAGQSPVLQLRDRDGTIRWTIRAEGREPGEIRSIRFPMQLLLQSKAGLARSGVVIGEAESSRGHGKLFLFITHNGDLRDYWYAW